MKKIGSGKVREIYEVSDKELVIYTTDRVSAFDVILPTPVPEKGRVLNQLSLFWFDLTKDIVKNHLVSADPKDMPEEFSKEEYKDRVMLVKKLKMLPYEFIIRGYMFGSMWKAYQAGEPFCGQVITGDYQLAQKLEKPILTPSTKATEGHDEYSVTHEGLVKDLGEELAQKLEDTCRILMSPKVDYLATNPDYVCPVEFGYVPDCGSICEMLGHAVKRTPYFIGKPETAMVEFALRQNHFTREETLVVGDRLYTDILCGHNAGVETALVLTGEATAEEAKKAEAAPDYIFASIGELYREWK